MDGGINEADYGGDIFGISPAGRRIVNGKRVRGKIVPESAEVRKEVDKEDDPAVERSFFGLAFNFWADDAKGYLKELIVYNHPANTDPRAKDKAREISFKFQSGLMRLWSSSLVFAEFRNKRVFIEKLKKWHDSNWRNGEYLKDKDSGVGFVNGAFGNIAAAEILSKGFFGEKPGKEAFDLIQHDESADMGYATDLLFQHDDIWYLFQVKTIRGKVFAGEDIIQELTTVHEETGVIYSGEVMMKGADVSRMIELEKKLATHGKKVRKFAIFVPVLGQHGADPDTGVIIDRVNREKYFSIIKKIKHR